MTEDQKMDKSKKKAGKAWMALGVIFIILGAAADSLGIGVSQGLGYKQVLIMAVGAVFFLVGMKACGCCGSHSCCQK